MRKGLRLPVDDPLVVICQKAVKRAGGLTRVGRFVGVSPQAVYKWEVVPEVHCSKVAQLSGYTINELRPDLYGLKGKDDGSNTSTSGPGATEMDGRAAATRQDDVGQGGNRLDDSAGNEHQPQPSIRPHLARRRDEPTEGQRQAFEEIRRFEIYP
jgi:hypothetical protein